MKVMNVTLLIIIFKYYSEMVMHMLWDKVNIDVTENPDISHEREEKRVSLMRLNKSSSVLGKKRNHGGREAGVDCSSRQSTLWTLTL